MLIREAEPGDAAAIERIRVRGWQAAYRSIYPEAFLDGLEIDWSRWEERISHPPEGWSSFVADAGGVVAGFAVCGPSREEAGIGELYALYVDPEAWATGIGQALLRRAEGRLAGAYAEASLWVLLENRRARRFYERSGWKLDPARKPFEFGGVSASGVLYRKALSSSASRR